jgi:glycosyltransferase involved in cell wall biosynthesis
MDDDVLVVPEFWVAEAAEAFPRQRKILFVQNSFSLFRSHARAEERGFDPRARVVGAIGISDTCIDALSLLDYDPIFRCPVAPNLSLFPYAERKVPKIGYMPRKRPLEAKIVMSALERRGRLGHHELVRIDGMAQPQVAEALRECLIFVSFMKTEALGFPAMEAMSAGCIVVGFTGLGTEEYFTPETGIPVPEGDLVKLVETIEDTISAYVRDPVPFDQMRAHASQMIAERYGSGVFENTLRDTWEALAARV